MYKLITTLLVLVLLGGCASMETVKQAKGEGEMRTYSYTYNTVYAATLSVVVKQGLKVVEQDKKKGEIMLSHGITAWSWGERVAVFLSSVSDSETKVEIISKAILSPLNVPPDWVTKLFSGIEEELKASR